MWLWGSVTLSQATHMGQSLERTKEPETRWLFLRHRAAVVWDSANEWTSHLVLDQSGQDVMRKH